MNEKMKKLIYLGIYLFSICVGAVISVYKILPVKNTAVLLLGFTVIWTGIAFGLDLTPYHAQKYSRKSQWAVSASAIGLGAVWSVISCTSWANQALPMICVSVPFLLIDFVIWLYNKKS